MPLYTIVYSISDFIYVFKVSCYVQDITRLGPVSGSNHPAVFRGIRSHPTPECDEAFWKQLSLHMTGLVRMDQIDILYALLHTH